MNTAISNTPEAIKYSLYFFIIGKEAIPPCIDILLKSLLRTYARVKGFFQDNYPFWGETLVGEGKAVAFLLRFTCLWQADRGVSHFYEASR